MRFTNTDTGIGIGIGITVIGRTLINDFMHNRKQDHEDSIERPDHDSSDMMTSLFEMMKKFTEKMEHQLYNANI